MANLAFVEGWVNVRPLIGITCGYDADEHQFRLNSPYQLAVEAAGGLPVLIGVSAELAPELLTRLDGIVFTGGADLDPALYGAEPAVGLGGVSPKRDAFEITLAREAYRIGLPTLGICRGCQLLAAAGGGTLYQDLPSERPGSIKHFQSSPRNHQSHAASVVAGTRLADVIGHREIRVNSFHHQAVRDLPAGSVLAATAPDGVVEAFEDPRHPHWLAIQWHPEGFWREDAAALALFHSLVEASARRAVSV